MKKILLGVLLASTAMSAQAADLAVKAPYYKAPVATVYDWTGFYLGVNAGVGLGRNRTQNYGNALAETSTYVSPLGGLGGAQIGYNWQTNGSFLGPIVFGVEADIQGSDLSDGYPNLGGVVQYNQKIDWFGTVRGRVGLATGPVLTYLTAGYAYGNVNTTVTEGGVGSSINGGRSGWTWGSGVEAALGGNWTAKIEYLWLDLGDRTDGLAFAGQSLRSELRENIFRVGLNYRIGGNSVYAPVAAANWAGLYLGGNLGSGTGRDRSSLVSGGAAPTAFLNTSPDGINGGVQAGYNWQAGNWVYGLETDIQGSAQEDNKTYALAPGAALNVNSKLPWFGTVRGRFGYSIGSSLFYATGGFAYGNVKTDINSVNVSQTQTGWTVGAGIETPFTFLGLFGPNWTTKTEYLYVDLGRSTNDFGAAGVFTTDVREHIFRTGLNYHFNTPVVAKY
ncbi:MAG TPA: outer membrane protein [Nitrobacter sp.]|jgi:outer membrane immunogenic protein|nr:outer membrane protein [Nitrobacter sp.]